MDAQSDLTGDDSKVSITLIRMSFHITGYNYDASRKLNKNQKMAKVKTSGDTEKLNTQYVPVPYDISFQLNVFTPTQDDGLTNIRTDTTIFSTRLYCDYDTRRNIYQRYKKRYTFYNR